MPGKAGSTSSGASNHCFRGISQAQGCSASPCVNGSIDRACICSDCWGCLAQSGMHRLVSRASRCTQQYLAWNVGAGWVQGPPVSPVPPPCLHMQRRAALTRRVGSLTMSPCCPLRRRQPSWTRRGGSGCMQNCSLGRPRRLQLCTGSSPRLLFPESVKGMQTARY